MSSRDELARLTHKKVVDTAASLFLKQGFRATTIRMIAGEAGVSVGTVMAAGEKSSLLVGIIDAAIGEVHNDRLGREIDCDDRSTPSDPVSQILQLFEPFLQTFAGQPELAREYASVLVSGRHESVIFTHLAEALREEIAEILRTAGVDSPVIAERAMAVYLAYIGTLFIWAGSGTTDPAPFIADLRSAITPLARWTGDRFETCS